MIQTSARLLRLLSLLQVRRSWSGADLAGRLGVTARTLRRDIARLRSLGYPIEGTAGVAGGYQLGAAATLPPLALEDDEALAVSIGLRTSASRATSGIEEAALRALVKLERLLPPRLRRRASALRASIALLERSGPRASSAVLATLASACDDRQRIAFRYADRSARTTDRVVEPAGLVHTGQRWYLVAWDVGRDGWRTFRVDRIAGRVSAGAHFAPRPPPDDGDLSGYVSRSVTAHAFRHQARILVNAPLETVAAHIAPDTGGLEPLDAERCVLTLGAPSLDGLALWTALLGVDFEVIDPPELIDYLRALHARIGRAIAASGP